jgi:hypothetical protein
MYPKWRSTHLDLGQGCSGTVKTGFRFEHVWSQDAHVLGALPPAVSQWNATTLRPWVGRRAAAAPWSASTARARRRHPSRAAAARMPHHEGPPSTQEGGRGRGATGRGAGMRAFNWARHPKVTSRATPARGNGGTGWRRASGGDARAAEEAEHGGLGHLRRCPCCCPSHCASPEYTYSAICLPRERR